MKLQSNAVRVALADRRAMKADKLMNLNDRGHLKPFAFRLAALNATGGEGRII